MNLINFNEVGCNSKKKKANVCAGGCTLMVIRESL